MSSPKPSTANGSRQSSSMTTSGAPSSTPKRAARTASASSASSSSSATLAAQHRPGRPVILYPAIDIRGGRCVRLVEGDFNRETAFDADPADAAARWAAAGAEWIHVVDLDGSVAGEPVNVEAITRIRAAVDVPIQLGGGLRTEEQLAAAFDLGINRAVLGTAAIRTPDLVPAAVARWGDAIAAGLDARDGKLAASGWLGTDRLRRHRRGLGLRAARQSSISS